MGHLRPRIKRSNVKLGEVFAGELARSLARGISATAGVVVLDIVHRLLAG
jgi:hypothetical protein